MQGLPEFAGQKPRQEVQIDDVRFGFRAGCGLLEIPVKDAHLLAGRPQLLFLALADHRDLLQRKAVPIEVFEHLRLVPDDAPDPRKMHVHDAHRQTFPVIPDVHAHLGENIDIAALGEHIRPLARAKCNRIEVSDGPVFIFAAQDHLQMAVCGADGLRLQDFHVIKQKHGFSIALAKRLQPGEFFCRIERQVLVRDDHVHVGEQEVVLGISFLGKSTYLRLEFFIVLLLDGNAGRTLMAAIL